MAIDDDEDDDYDTDVAATAYESSTRICAHVAESLERHYPASDAEVCILMKFCRRSVRFGSRRMIDASESPTIERTELVGTVMVMG